jgi:hypothetical protein
MLGEEEHRIKEIANDTHFESLRMDYSWMSLYFVDWKIDK